MAITERKSPRRSRAANKVFRRQQLIDATIDCIDKLGFSDTTIAKVAERAGVSQGIVIFHFKTKDGLLLETLQYLTEEYMNVYRQKLDEAGPTPIDKIAALIHTDFDPLVCNRKKIGVWYAFWGEAKTRPTYLKVCDQRDAERYEYMRQFCTQACEAEGGILKGDAAAMGIDGALDGMWMRVLLNNRGGIQDDKTMVFNLFESLFPSQAEQIRLLAQRK
ncbi:TetR family transcriptional regulator [Aestuariispira insulae]|uniref:TetR family transcriptional regulator n=1 Tax=Aestuariispira insulae TaxID=1461337 RepID=A0A3D9H553_9PROT|nr:TetR family transcriptional regulator [Aestuariispira insulae]RED44648.1 TetR family transcriptional regulator [Aestuariispira insulae]